jgi:hypothetical protein
MPIGGIGVCRDRNVSGRGVAVGGDAEADRVLFSSIVTTTRWANRFPAGRT